MFIEQTNCHFFPKEECRYPIPEDEFKAAIEEAEEDEIIGQIPGEDSPFCTSCSLAQLLFQMKDWQVEERVSKWNRAKKDYYNRVFPMHSF